MESSNFWRKFLAVKKLYREVPVKYFQAAKQGLKTFRSSFSDLFRGRKSNTNFFFSNFSGTAGISRQNPGIPRQKSLIFLVSRDIPNFLAPAPSRGRPPPRPKFSGVTRTFGFGFVFLPWFFFFYFFRFQKCSGALSFCRRAALTLSAPGIADRGSQTANHHRTQGWIARRKSAHWGSVIANGWRVPNPPWC